MRLGIAFLTIAFIATGIASATTVTADVINGGSPVITDNKGYDVGPYTLKVNGITYAALCVDFTDQATLGQSYSAYETQVGGNLSNTYHPGDAAQYEEEAYLMSLITQPGADRIDIQHAAWAITDSSYQANSAAQNYINLAEQNYKTFNYSQYDIISDTNSGCNRGQEFLIDGSPAAASPEPASLVLLGGGLLVAGLVRRTGKKQNA